MNEDIVKVLEEIGLSNAEIQVYLSLIRLGESKIGKIIKQVKVSSSNVHDACDKLIRKGVISFIIKNNVKHYYPIDPESLIILIKKEEEKIKIKKEELNLIIPKIKSLETITKNEQNAEIFTGFNGVLSAFKKLYKYKLKNEENLFFYEFNDSNVEKVHKFFAKMDIEDYYKDIPIRGLFSNGYKKHFKLRKKRDNFRVKFTDHPILSNVNVYGDKTLITSWGEEPVAFLIQSKEITETFKKNFENIWRLT